MFGNASPYPQVPVGFLSQCDGEKRPHHVLGGASGKNQACQEPLCALSLSQRPCSSRSLVADMCPGRKRGCCHLSCQHLPPRRGRGRTEPRGHGPYVQGPLVSPGTSVTAITHPGLWFRLHDPEQPVRLRSSQKD